ncbi:MAG: hypothetical protein ABI782_00330 [Anaerolineaceae bacterium]
MFSDFLYRFQLLLSTSPEIERRALVSRPRFMAAAWGGMVVCKVAAMALLSIPATPMLVAVLVGGAAATQFRFRHQHGPALGVTPTRQPILA